MVDKYTIAKKEKKKRIQKYDSAQQTKVTVWCDQNVTNYSWIIIVMDPHVWCRCSALRGNNWYTLFHLVR